jgi:hypothetical protein
MPISGLDLGLDTAEILEHLDQLFRTQGMESQYKLYCQLERTFGRSLKALAGPDPPSKPITAIILLGLRSCWPKIKRAGTAALYQTHRTPGCVSSA